MNSHSLKSCLTLKKSLVIGFLTICSLYPAWASKVGDALPYTKVSNGVTLKVSTKEDIANVALQFRKPGTQTWTTLSSYPNDLGTTELSLSVPASARSLDLRVIATQIRAVPATIAFTKDATGKSLIIKKPAMGAKMSVEAFDAVSKQWKRISLAEQKTNNSDVRISLSEKYRNSTLRVSKLDPAKPSLLSGRFPSTFRKGKSTFEGKEVSGQNSAAGDLIRPLAVANGVDSAKTTEDPTSNSVEEADIWRVFGKKIFFFNQLRGLQVIDTTDSKSPEIISSLRMPAVGEDMYVLGDNKALLVQRDYYGNGKTIVVSVNTSKPQAVADASVDIAGWYVDSRKIGDRLVVLTQTWDPKTYASKSKISLIENLGSTPRLAASADLDRNSSLMGVTADYIWIAGTSQNSWRQSTITLFPIKNLPTLTASSSFDLGGNVWDKFKIHQNGQALFAVTQSWNSNWRGVTSLESYSLATSSPTLLKSVTLVEGESLHATRFDGDRAYIVTFFQKDPLWIMDLSDPANPSVVSELQVPGWSSYIQPMGDYLAAIGVDDGALTASLFDVKDPANPSLSSRVSIGENGYTWSEANWNEKAVAILAEQNLILLPYQSYSYTDGSSSAVQLIDMNLVAGKLTKRGIISHAFQPRRATALQEGIIASISNRELILVDATNRDKPTVLSDCTLAFGVDRIVYSTDKYLVHTENGAWNSGSSTIRVSTTDSEDNVIAEATLPPGRVIASGSQGNRLAVLVENNSSPAKSSLIVYRLDSLPALVESGRCEVSLNSSYNSRAQILWPTVDTVVAAICNSGWGCFYPRPMVMDALPVASMARSSVAYGGIYGGYWNPEDTVQLISFNLNGATPIVASTMNLADLKPHNTSNFFTVDGLVIFSTDVLKEEVPKPQPTPTPVASKVGNSSILTAVPFIPINPNPRTTMNTSLQVIDYADPAAPFQWPSASLPGKLENIAEWDRTAGLVFTSRSNSTGGLTLDALLFEGGAASAITSWDSGKTFSPFVFSGRSLYVAETTTINRRILSNTGQFVASGSLANLAWQPYELAIVGNSLLFRSGANLGASTLTLNKISGPWSIPGWSWQLPEVKNAGNSWAVPLGEYGVEILK